jgi:nicotinate-nucleotide adenylyltransferase
MTEAPASPRRGSPRIGLLGGTFNPIHLGHLRMAESLCEAFSLRPFVFIPSAIPPHKSQEGLSPGDLRLEMVRIATAGNPALGVSDLELRRGGTSYSVETLESLREEHGAGAELHFAMGDDAFAEIETWKEWPRIFTMTHIIVVARPGAGERAPQDLLPVEARDAFCYSEKEDAFMHSSGKKVFFRDVGALPISSTIIREFVRTGRSIRHLVPEGVREFIQRHGLYLKPDPGAR